jgi:transposase
MDTSRPGTSVPGIPRNAPSLPERRRQHRSPELKRRIVEETLAPGASVARVAREHGVNANQVFAWRRQHREEAQKKEVPGLLAVRVAEEPAPARACRVRPTPSGTMRVELPGGKIQVTGIVDAEALRVVLKELLA